MDTNNDEKPVSTDKPKKRFVRSAKKYRKMTPAEKAEAVGLWRSGEVTLEELAKKFGKRRETFSRMFSEMGIKKGEAAVEHQERVAKELETKILADAAAAADRIVRVKDEHFRMADALGKLVWKEIVTAKNAGVPLEKIRGTMQTLNLASSTLSNVRSELYKILQIDKHDEKGDDDELPELTVRELTEDEVVQLQEQHAEDETSLDIEDDGLVEETGEPDERLNQ